MKYKALAPVTAHVGALVKLSKAKAARTVGLVEPVAKPAGWARVVVAFQFKAGEVFETDMAFGKGATHVEPLDEPAKPAAKAEPTPATA